jgi:23S rRNA pseudouridine2604 synthase
MKALPDSRPAEDAPAGIRINKYIAESGTCSRREADRLIALNQVTIDERPADLGSRVLPGQTVRIKGEPVLIDEDFVYLALNKPTGITSTTDPKRSDSIVRLVGHEKRLFPVGRLDRDSEGLIFLTNDGSIVNKILRAGNRHEKEYLVTVDKPVTNEFLTGMSRGVPILNTVTRACRIRAVGPRSFRIILMQGLNRQIRRMCEYFGYQVQRLVRVRIMNITLGSLKSGEWRSLTPKEITGIRRLIQESSSDPDWDNPR